MVMSSFGRIWDWVYHKLGGSAVYSSSRLFRWPGNFGLYKSYLQ